MLQIKPSIPTMSTVPFQSPSFPTSSHFPVTVTSLGALVDGALVEGALVLLVFAEPGLAAGAAVFAGLPPPQEPTNISPTRTITNVAFFIASILLTICFPGECLRMPRG